MGSKGCAQVIPGVLIRKEDSSVRLRLANMTQEASLQPGMQQPGLFNGFQGKRQTQPEIYRETVEPPLKPVKHVTMKLLAVNPNHPMTKGGFQKKIKNSKLLAKLSKMFLFEHLHSNFEKVLI
jgi:hypothetical protein